jgi:3-deoxy-D-manno-octulosonic acid kinase
VWRLPELPPLPEGYLRRESRRGVLWVRRECDAAFARAGFGPENEIALPSSEHAGRRPLGLLAIEDGSCLVRSYSHGGLVRWLTGRRFLDARRPFAELSLSEMLRARGIATPEVVAARARRAPLVGWELDLATREVPDTEDLATLFSRLQRGEIQRRSLARLLPELGRFLERAHSAGLDHADLQPANLLLEVSALHGAAPRYWILDLDRSRLGPPLALEERGKNLGRLLRHVRRRQAESGSAELSQADLARVLVGYEGDRAARKRLWSSLRSHATSTLFLHRIGWRLERIFGRARATPREAHAG